MSLRVLALLGANHESRILLDEFAAVDADTCAMIGPCSAEMARHLAPDVIVSYNHRHLVPTDVLAIPRFGTVNLHPAFLPFNRGAHPIFWAVAEGTPLGVTVHRMDAGLDTGPILGQRRVLDEPGDTLESLYRRAHVVLRALFWSIWPVILDAAPGMPQQGEGTYHRMADLPDLPDGWRTRVEDVLRQFQGAAA